jgi:hypothetical protein
MFEKREMQREGRVERRRHPRAETTARYRRLRAEIAPPPVFADAGRLMLGWLGRIRMRARIWRYRNRKAVA